MKRLSLILVALFAITFFAMADAPLATDNEPGYQLYTAANPTDSARAGDIGGTQDMTDGITVLVTVDTSTQSYVDK